MSYDKILELLVHDLTESLQAPFDDDKKRGLDRSTVVTDRLRASETLRALRDITRQSVYIPESLTFQAAMEPLLCCICSSERQIRVRTIEVLEYLLQGSPAPFPSSLLTRHPQTPTVAVSLRAVGCPSCLLRC